MIAVYLRVSTEDQAEQGYSLESQWEKCLKKAGTNNVLKYVEDGITGETLRRPAFLKLIRDAESGLIDTLVTLDPDRLSRNHTNQMVAKDELVRKNNVKLVFVNGDLTISKNSSLYDILTFEMRSVIASFEKGKIRERTMEGRKYKAKAGKVVRNYETYGYDYDRQTEQFVINEQEAKVVQLIFDLFTSPSFTKGINGIAKYLTSQGIPTKRGAKQWHRQVVRQILMNRTYIGELYQNKWNTEGILLNKFAVEGEKKVSMTLRPQDEWILTPCPAIISEDQFNYTQRLIDTSRRLWAGNPKNDYFLSGLLRCGECGNTLTGRKAKNWGRYVFEYTDRKNTAGAKNPGCCLTIKCSDIDEQVWNTIEQWLQSPAEISATIEADEPALSFEEAELERIAKEIEKLERKIQRLVSDVYGAEDESEVAYEKQELDKCKKLLKELKEERARLEDVLSKEKEAQLSEDILQGAVDYYLSNKEELTREHKKELVRMIVKEIRIYKDERIDIFTY